MHIPASLQPRYRNRKGTLSQNVLAACDFDLKFTYILAGWEGSAHDARVLSDAQVDHGFYTPKGRYWLGDAGYGNSEFIMTPYRGVRYHLKEQRQADQKPQNAKELFNLRHSSLRNVIERIFGVLKRKFKILGGRGCEYSIDTQVHLICGLSGLFNFLQSCKEDSNCGCDINEGQEFVVDISGQNRELQYKQQAGSKVMDGLRDELTRQMWIDYQAIVA